MLDPGPVLKSQSARYMHSCACVPSCSWPQHVLRVESMINNQPCTIFNQGKTRNQMLLGAVSQHTKRPSAVDLAALLGFSRWGRV